MMSDGSPPPSICFIRAAESYPKSQMEKEDSQLFVTFPELAGESIKYLGRTDDGVLALSNYRIFVSMKSTAFETYVPLGLIESVQVRDLFQLVVNCKDASTVRCSFQSADQCLEWQRRIQLLIGIPETLETLFAFPFYSWTCDDTTTLQQLQHYMGNQQKEPSNEENAQKSLATTTTTTAAATAATSELQSQSSAPLKQLSQPFAVGEQWNRLQRATPFESDFMNEVARLGFDLKGSWRISTANTDFKLCPSYPQKLLVPCCITDEMLHNIANFRGSRRLPAVVWRHQKSGAILARCSQPEVGWLGWRNYKDEQLLKALADACAFDRGEHARRQAKDSNGGETAPATAPGGGSSSGKSSPSLEDSSHEELALDEIRKILIVDARSYTSAVTNRARGGGCECIEYYPCAEIEFMNLGNIHAIRKSFHAVRQLCASSPDEPNWLGQLEKTMWLQHMSGLLGATMTVVHTIEKNGRPVLVHCSDGWDRTPQIVASAQLCLDPYYRTVEGFRILVEREWLNFGHKFADRSGNGPNSDEVNERCPVFLQWLDLVHQIHKQFPCSFEFSIAYLIKLAQHSLSCLFGTFLCNSLKERIENSVFDRTFSVWSFLAERMYRNPLYKHETDKVLWPAHNVRYLHFWSDVYLGSLGNKNGTEHPLQSNERQGAGAAAAAAAGGVQNGNASSSNGTANGNGATAKTRSTENITTNELSQSTISRRSSDPNLAVESIVNDGLTGNANSNSMFDIRSDETKHDITSTSTTQEDSSPDSAKLYEEVEAEVQEEEEEEEKIQQNGCKTFTTELKNDQSSSSIQCEPLKEETRTLNGNITVQRIDSEPYDSPNDDAPSISDAFIKEMCHELQQVQIDTSTDTIIPTENTHTQQSSNGLAADNDVEAIGDGVVARAKDDLPQDNNKKIEAMGNVAHTNNKNSQCYNSLPRVHVKASERQCRNDKPDEFQLESSESSSKEQNGIADASTTDDVDSTPPTPKQAQRAPTTTTTATTAAATTTEAEPETPPSSTFVSSTYEMMSTSGMPARPNMVWSIRDITTQSKYTDNVGSLNYPSTGLISLPPTPQGSQEQRTQFNISCPDGLAHGLSEQNIRLHQIVQEHKLREEVLMREIHGMRLALQQKGCPSCNSVVSTNVEHENGSDIVENASTCSWEAVEERCGGPSSYATSTVHEKKASSVLWVPDHAVSRCSSCQIEFWFGRRKHHCRSCGEIFCADCSEFWAPLPFEKLFNPVRLCGSCYLTVTTQIHECRVPFDPISTTTVTTTATKIPTTATKTTTANDVTKPSANSQE